MGKKTLRNLYECGGPLQKVITLPAECLERRYVFKFSKCLRNIKSELVLEEEGRQKIMKQFKGAEEGTERHDEMLAALREYLDQEIDFETCDLFLEEVIVNFKDTKINFDDIGSLMIFFRDWLDEYEPPAEEKKETIQ